MADEGHLEVAISMAILREINRVLGYDRISKALRRSETPASTIIATILRVASVVDVKSRLNKIKEDPEDNHVLACAKDAGADFIVSGDKHLLRLGRLGKIPIVRASENIDVHARRKRLSKQRISFLDLIGSGSKKHRVKEMTDLLDRMREEDA